MTWVQVFHKLLCLGNILHVPSGGYYISLKQLIGVNMLVIWSHFEFENEIFTLRIITYDFLPQFRHSVLRLKNTLVLYMRSQYA